MYKNRWWLEQVIFSWHWERSFNSLPSLPSSFLLKEEKSRKRSCQEKGGYLVLDRSNISFLSIINGVWSSAFPVWDIEAIITAGMRGRYFESSHLLNHLFTGLGQRTKRQSISRELRQTGQVVWELRFNSPCPPSGSWPVHMYGHQERPQDYGWKYASSFFPKLNAERFHPPKQKIVFAQTVSCV